MKRTSYLAELEVIYVYALRTKNYQVGEGSQFLLTILEYIDNFYDKADVTEDLKPYLRLLNPEADVETVKLRLVDRIKQAEQIEAESEKMN
jgi:hypothetical protein